MGQVLVSNAVTVLGAQRTEDQEPLIPDSTQHHTGVQNYATEE